MMPWARLLFMFVLVFFIKTGYFSQRPAQSSSSAGSSDGQGANLTSSAAHGTTTLASQTPRLNLNSSSLIFAIPLENNDKEENPEIPFTPPFIDYDPFASLHAQRKAVVLIPEGNAAIPFTPPFIDDDDLFASFHDQRQDVILIPEANMSEDIQKKKLRPSKKHEELSKYYKDYKSKDNPVQTMRPRVPKSTFFATNLNG